MKMKTFEGRDGNEMNTDEVTRVLFKDAVFH